MKSACAMFYNEFSMVALNKEKRLSELKKGQLYKSNSDKQSHTPKDGGHSQYETMVRYHLQDK